MTKMSNDEGTKPGMTSDTPEVPRPAVSMRCKEPNCDSMQARVIQDATPDGTPTQFRMYQCCKCGAMTNVAVGGGVTF